MSDYTILDQNNLLLGYVNIASCDCKHLVHVGNDLNDNRIMYNPQKHTIKECNESNNKCVMDISSYMWAHFKLSWRSGCEGWVPTFAGTPNHPSAQCSYWKDSSNNMCISGNNGRCTTGPPCPTPPSTCVSLNISQCTAWKNIYNNIDNSLLLQKYCSNIYTAPCDCSDIITCSNKYIVQLDFDQERLENKRYVNVLSNININLNTLYGLSNLTGLEINNNINGTLSDLAKLKQLDSIGITKGSNNIVGNLSDISRLHNLFSLTILEETSISGSLSNLSKLNFNSSNSSIIISDAPNITGNLKDISDIGSTYIILPSSILDGSCQDISNFLTNSNSNDCKLRVKDYSNCINDFSSHCTFYP